jgi:hypothetical protein
MDIRIDDLSGQDFPSRERARAEIRIIGGGQTDGLIVRNFQGTAVRT